MYADQPNVWDEALTAAAGWRFIVQWHLLVCVILLGADRLNLIVKIHLT